MSQEIWGCTDTNRKKCGKCSKLCLCSHDKQTSYQISQAPETLRVPKHTNTSFRRLCCTCHSVRKTPNNPL